MKQQFFNKYKRLYVTLTQNNLEVVVGVF